MIDYDDRPTAADVLPDGFIITDYDGREMVVGTRVHMWDADLDVPADVDSVVGTVIDLGEWDGDCDDEGRSIGIAPRVAVRFDDGTTEEFVTSEWEYEGWAYYSVPVAGQVEELNVFGPLPEPKPKPDVPVSSADFAPAPTAATDEDLPF